MRIGFTGTRRSLTLIQRDAIRSTMAKYVDPDRAVEFHYGDCFGADTAAFQIALCLGMVPVCHPPLSPRLRSFTEAPISRAPKEYLDRNKDIVNDTDLLIAAPGELAERVRSGTWSTVRYARKTGKPVIIVYPNGEVKHDA